ncbi:hypothetical protein N7474_001162 [Penicillium riverlandense]|uniref:uncharacterized protein n=1 Tax=Penicillium riverlandense TaxID=1903569 RepID=UPI0025471E45|nr:uncharacterized protein N7474_001162 [Penicillium riverlandense]KAJ5832851.1 hypothetical protein N7474_001162 [Penicillium riverlandense]
MKQTRASKPKVRTGCITCKSAATEVVITVVCTDVDRARRVKCDEGKPTCTRCTDTGRKCEGYAVPASSAALLPIEVAPRPEVASPVEPRALDFFFHKTAPHLAGFFEASFFQGSVLQLSLAEPAIRQAIAAIASLHELEAPDPSLPTDTGLSADLPVRLYNQSIRSIIDRAAGNNAMPVVAVANILYTCFEFLRGNAATAANHVRSGINLLQSYREQSGGAPAGPWGQKYQSFESHFMETEIAPLLSLFNVNVLKFGRRDRARLLLNSVDDIGQVVLADRFETPREARVALLDLISISITSFEYFDQVVSHGELPMADILVFFDGMRTGLRQWKAKFEDLARRQEHSWNQKEQAAANVIHVMGFSGDIGMIAYQVNGESDWDAYRSEYVEFIQLAESLVSDEAHYPDPLAKVLSLDFGMIFPLHAVAWKCRWPHLRRKGLDLFHKIPKREWSLVSERYHAIFSRIMEIEESHLQLAPGTIPDENVLPPEHARIHDFQVAPHPISPDERPLFAVSFFSKPNGLDSDWHCQTEYLHLGTSESAESAELAVPSNLIARRPWASSELSDPNTIRLLKSAVFGSETELLVRASPGRDL